jgi:hypothetical protein
MKLVRGLHGVLSDQQADEPASALSQRAPKRSK